MRLWGAEHRDGTGVGECSRPVRATGQCLCRLPERGTVFISGSHRASPGGTVRLPVVPVCVINFL